MNGCRESSTNTVDPRRRARRSQMTCSTNRSYTRWFSRCSSLAWTPPVISCKLWLISYASVRIFMKKWWRKWTVSFKPRMTLLSIMSISLSTCMPCCARLYVNMTRPLILFRAALRKTTNLDPIISKRVCWSVRVLSACRITPSISKIQGSSIRTDGWAKWKLVRLILTYLSLQDLKIASDSICRRLKRNWCWFMFCKTFNSSEMKRNHLSCKCWFSINRCMKICSILRRKIKNFEIEVK